MVSKLILVATLLLSFLVLEGCDSGPDETASSTKPPQPEHQPHERPEAAAPRRVTAKSLLHPQEAEGSDFGLYSYLLLPHQASDAKERERYRAAIAGFIERFSDVQEVEEYVSARDLNVFYLPVHRDPTTEPSWEAMTSDEKIDRLLEQYDHARAAAILRCVPRAHEEGPYIVSYDRPLSRQTELLDRPFLFQNLSAAQPKIYPAWFAAFSAQAAKPDFWRSDRIEETVLHLRNDIAVASDDVDAVKEAMTGWITWAKGVGDPKTSK